MAKMPEKFSSNSGTSPGVVGEDSDCFNAWISRTFTGVHFGQLVVLPNQGHVSSVCKSPAG